ncbi:hypothetical protein I7I50_00886 [Histoplasma capsulatum G186AR]|uniref:Secreted protein n=1 Tax=Ajellomyces capsulatus TaxID=5037 RepID=A0A8H7YJQ4_AJECA|nr:hypothetical protein I7I52_08152 [Histoplasma capsulatum]QSS72898.1 hypothetical protein I7I50_00886 [Histoplasma capsulatum G186AR]
MVKVFVWLRLNGLVRVISSLSESSAPTTEDLSSVSRWFNFTWVTSKMENDFYMPIVPLARLIRAGHNQLPFRGT